MNAAAAPWKHADQNESIRFPRGSGATRFASGGRIRQSIARTAPSRGRAAIRSTLGREQL